MAHSSASKKSKKDGSGSDSEEEVNNDPSFLIVENADNRDDERPTRRRGSIGLCFERLRRRWWS
jgi:hypothetical protein